MTKETAVKPLRKPGDKAKEEAKKAEEAAEKLEEKKVEATPKKAAKTKKNAKDVQDFFKKYWKALVTTVAIVALIVIIALVYVFNSKAKLNSMLESMGRDWYENFYWQQVGTDDATRKAFLERYKDVGIKVNLDNLSRYNASVNASKVAEFHPDEDGGCNAEDTMVTIKPTDPYGQSNYTVSTTLVCGK